MAKDETKEVKPKKKKSVRTKGPKLVSGEYPYVDLMPATRRSAIEVKDAKAKWVRIVIGGTVVAVVLALGSFGFKFVNQMTYDAAQADAAAVEVKIDEYAEVDDALTIQNSIESNVEKGSAASITWQDLESRISSNLPAESSLSSFRVVTGGDKNDPYTVAVLVNVSSLQPIAYSQILDSFGKVPGILGDSLQIGNLTASTTATSVPIYSYPVAFSIDTSILSQRFAYLTDEDAATEAAPEKIDEEQLPVPTPEETEEGTD